MLINDRSAKSFDDYFLTQTPAVFEFLSKLLYMQDRLALITFRKSWQVLFNGRFVADGRRYFEEHYSAVANSASKDKLLYWDVKDGWGPLCEAFGQPVPDAAFPHLNTGASLGEAIRGSHFLMSVNLAMRAIEIVAYASLLWVLWMVFVQ